MSNVGDIPTPKDAERAHAPKARAKFLADVAALRRTVIKEIERQYPVLPILVDTDNIPLDVVNEVCGDLRIRGWETELYHGSEGDAPGIKIQPLPNKKEKA